MPPKKLKEAGPRLIEVDEANFDALPCCGIKNPEHPGRVEKRRWLRANARLGLRAKVLLSPDGKQAGYIEAIPGEHVWRGVDAAGYLFIHCVWIHSRQHQGKGWGQLMVEACVADAQKAGMKGVAVAAREGPWMANPRLFLACGFEAVDTAPPDYELLVRKFDEDAANPAFNRDFDRRAAKYKRGLTIVRSSQCPYIAKFTAEIARAAASEYGIEPRIVELRTPRDAQNAPTPYAVFAIIHDGHVVADHQISCTRFRNIMKGIEP